MKPNIGDAFCDYVHYLLAQRIWPGRQQLRRRFPDLTPIAIDHHRARALAKEDPRLVAMVKDERSECVRPIPDDKDAAVIQERIREAAALKRSGEWPMTEGRFVFGRYKVMQLYDMQIVPRERKRYRCLLRKRAR